MFSCVESGGGRCPRTASEPKQKFRRRTQSKQMIRISVKASKWIGSQKWFTWVPKRRPLRLGKRFFVEGWEVGGAASLMLGAKEHQHTMAKNACVSRPLPDDMLRMLALTQPGTLRAQFRTGVPDRRCRECAPARRGSGPEHWRAGRIQSWVEAGAGGRDSPLDDVQGHAFETSQGSTPTTGQF